MAADTSSSAAASTAVVGTAAAALAELIVEPRPAKSFAAVEISSGTAIKLEIFLLLPGVEPPRLAISIARNLQRQQGLLRRVSEGRPHGFTHLTMAAAVASAERLVTYPPDGGAATPYPV